MRFTDLLFFGAAVYSGTSDASAIPPQANSTQLLRRENARPKFSTPYGENDNTDIIALPYFGRGSPPELCRSWVRQLDHETMFIADRYYVGFGTTRKDFRRKERNDWKYNDGLQIFKQIHNHGHCWGRTIFDTKMEYDHRWGQYVIAFTEVIGPLGHHFAKCSQEWFRYQWARFTGCETVEPTPGEWADRFKWDPQVDEGKDMSEDEEYQCAVKKDKAEADDYWNKELTDHNKVGDGGGN